MEDSEEKPAPERFGRLRTAAAIIGMSLWGPAFLFTTISWFVNGKLPGKGSNGGIDATDHPLLFYFLITLFGAVALLFTYMSIRFVIGYFYRHSTQ
jgi:hypothetical protein